MLTQPLPSSTRGTTDSHQCPLVALSRRCARQAACPLLGTRAPEVTIEPDGKPAPQVINIMDALKQSMQKLGQAKVRDAVRKRMGKAAPKGEAPRPATRSRASARRSLH